MEARAILVVEDDALIRMTVVDALEERGLRVIEATTGDEAADRLAAEPAIAVLFTDIRIPGSMDGVALARHARSVNPKITVLCTSGLQAVPDLDHAEAGNIRFLPKPYRISALVREIDQILEGPAAASKTDAA